MLIQLNLIWKISEKRRYLLHCSLGLLIVSHGFFNDLVHFLNFFKRKIQKTLTISAHIMDVHLSLLFSTLYWNLCWFIFCLFHSLYLLLLSHNFQMFIGVALLLTKSGWIDSEFRISWLLRLSCLPILSILCIIFSENSLLNRIFDKIKDFSYLVFHWPKLYLVTSTTLLSSFKYVLEVKLICRLRALFILFQHVEGSLQGGLPGIVCNGTGFVVSTNWWFFAIRSVEFTSAHVSVIFRDIVFRKPIELGQLRRTLWNLTHRLQSCLRPCH